jgi:hypothetical protein
VGALPEEDFREGVRAGAVWMVAGGSPETIGKMNRDLKITAFSGGGDVLFSCAHLSGNISGILDYGTPK